MARRPLAQPAERPTRPLPTVAPSAANDRTGLGVAVMDIFRAAYRDGTLVGSTWPVGVTITGGDHGTDFNVPKADLMGAVQTVLQAGRLRIPAGPLVEQLQRELLALRQRISAAGRTTYDHPRREGEGHGDLVMALALALVWPNSLRKLDFIDQELTSLGPDALPV